MTKKYIVRLEPQEREDLLKLLSRGKGAARKLAHARMLLQADVSEGGSRLDRRTNRRSAGSQDADRRARTLMMHCASKKYPAQPGGSPAAGSRWKRRCCNPEKGWTLSM